MKSACVLVYTAVTHQTKALEGFQAFQLFELTHSLFLSVYVCVCCPIIARSTSLCKHLLQRLAWFFDLPLVLANLVL